MNEEGKARICSENEVLFNGRMLVVVKAKDILPSSILPSRNHEPQLAESVKTVGMQQFPIVRVHPTLPNKFEIIDGTGRVEGIDAEDEVCCDVREKVSDAGIFKISEATSKRNQRNAYENAVFYDAYVETVKKETGEKGAIARVATEAQISESELSQYLSIKKLFDKLSLLDSELEFPKLKRMGINKLYALSNLVDHPKFLETAQEVEQKAEWLTTEAITELVCKVHHAEIEKMVEELGDFSDSQSSAIPQVKLNGLPDKISKMMKELSTLLPQFESRISNGKFASPETRRVLEKVSVSLRRLLCYLRRLEKLKEGAYGEVSTVDKTQTNSP
jgi:hypothetical protein